MNDSLDKLVKSVSRITDLYEMNEETTNSNQDRQLSSDRPTSPVFLSQISQDEYNKTEDKCDHLSNNTTFFNAEGVARLLRKAISDSYN
jgi:hypothetical protein